MSYGVFCTPNKPWLWLFLVICISSGCSSQHKSAPVIDAWHQVKSSLNNHIVLPGDTLYSIAWRYGRDYRELAAINALHPPYELAIGQRIYLKQAKHSSVAKMDETPRIVENPVLKVESNPIPDEPDTPNPKQWVWPAHGDIIQRFAGNSKGIDIKGKVGAPVYSAADGKVVYAGNGLRGYGELLIIKHNAEYLSAYAHNRKLLVKEGDPVLSGQVIAEMGDSEANQVMLHFEIRKAGKPIDPLQLLPTTR